VSAYDGAKASLAAERRRVLACKGVAADQASRRAEAMERLANGGLGDGRGGE